MRLHVLVFASACLFDCATPFSLAGLVDLVNGKQPKSTTRTVGGERNNQESLTFRDTERRAKGIHDKGARKQFYDIADGNKRGYFDDNGIFRLHNAASKGKKGFRLVDHGKYAKGHNIRGSHNVHKLDEFKKKTDFFDEDHDAAFNERHGGYQKQLGYNEGANAQGQQFNKGFLEAAFGLGGLFEKSARSDKEKGRSVQEGSNGFSSKGEKFSKGGGNGAFNQWGVGVR